MTLTEELKSPLGLIAGNGSFPLEFVESAQRRGLSVVAVAHTGETDAEIERYVDQCTWVKVGELGKIIKTFKKAGVKQAFFAGGIKRIKLFGGVRLDLKGLSVLSKVRSVKDDAILRGIADEIEQNGIRVLSASILLENSVPSEGLLTSRALTAEEREDALVAWDAARAIGALDIGQSVVACEGIVTAVEAVEGTDAAIRRGAELAKNAGVVVKLCKPHQDLRFDLPAVGTKTIEVMAECGVTALVIEAGKSLILNRQAFVEKANNAKIAVLAAESKKYLLNQ
ncbi:MAG: LpxI family protein [Candidatus Dadabacteria bacterium]|nr:MAG: LpxI family protein [Candidatus Dadabacteria bacterium]